MGGGMATGGGGMSGLGQPPLPLMSGLDPQRLVSAARDSARVRGALAGRARVGTCGFTQIHIVAGGYPVAPKQQHAYYGERFGCAELDGCYYHMPAEATFHSWRRLATSHAARADPYEYLPKINKFFTHMKRLIVDEKFRERFASDMQRFAILGGACPAVLVQFNGTSGEARSQCFERTAETHSRLVAFAELLSARAHVAASGGQQQHGGFDPFFVLEFRHASWYCEEVYELIAAHPRLTLAQIHHQRCNGKFGGLADGWWPADNVAARLWKKKVCYVRLHGTAGFCVGDYGRAAMQQVAERMAAYLRANAGCKAYALFNNDAAPHGQPSFAVCDGYALGEALSSF